MRKKLVLSIQEKNHSLNFFSFITPDIARMVTLDFETVKYIKESTSCVYGFQEKKKNLFPFGKIKMC